MDNKPECAKYGHTWEAYRHDDTIGYRIKCVFCGKRKDSLMRSPEDIYPKTEDEK